VKPETADYIDKARRCLSNGRANLSIRLSNDAGRNAYLTAYHAAQAYIFNKTGKIAKSHNGVQSLFAQLASKDAFIPEDLQKFISQAYDLKAVADYELGPGSDIPLERSIAALEKAARLLDCIAGLVENDDSGKS
jgi:uncharacterized protein (UPF0332 family)